MKVSEMYLMSVWFERLKKKIFSQVSISHYIFLIFNENQQEKKLLQQRQPTQSAHLREKRESV